MRHRKKGRKLNRTASHRKAMFRNMATDFLRHGAITTTEAKAKELRRYVEPLITLAKKNEVPRIRRASRFVRDPEVVQKLFQVIAPTYVDRPGGYTRIHKLGIRQGDNAAICRISLV